MRSRRTWARLAAALGVAAVMVASTAGPASAQPGESDERGGSSDPIPILAGQLVPQPDPESTAGADQPAAPEADQPTTSEADPADIPETDQPATSQTDPPGPQVGLPAPTEADPPGTPGPHAAAPTVGLRLLADAVTVSNSSVTLNVNVPPGINTSPTEISVLYGVSRMTVQYDSARGTYIDVQFPPKDGRYAPSIWPSP